MKIATTKIARIRCDIFVFLSDEKKTKKTFNRRKLPKDILTIPIAYFCNLKTCDASYLLLFNYVKVFFFLLVVGWKESLSFHGREVDFADGIVFLV